MHHLVTPRNFDLTQNRHHVAPQALVVGTQLLARAIADHGGRRRSAVVMWILKQHQVKASLGWKNQEICLL